MNKYILKSTSLSLLISLFVLASCSSDDDNTTPAATLQVQLTEVGHGATPNTHAGEELHLEAEILASAKIANVKLEIQHESNSAAPLIEILYNDYNGLINATFHKHVLIPANQPVGTYHLHLTVTDMDGNVKTAQSDLEILSAEEQSGIDIAITELGHGSVGSSHVDAGGDLHISGTIVSVHAVATISMEIHSDDIPGAQAIEATFNNYAGQTTINFHEHIDIPASQPAGHYHVHFTVTDDEGHSQTAEYELEIE